MTIFTTEPWGVCGNDLLPITALFFSLSPSLPLKHHLLQGVALRGAASTAPARPASASSLRTSSQATPKSSSASRLNPKHPTPYNLHPTPCTPHPTTYTLHPTP